MKIGAVLTYTSNGRGGTGGQVMGMDGSGDFAVLFHGEPDECDEAATDYIERLMKSGNRIRRVSLIRSDEGYYGSAISHIHTKE